MLGTPAFQAPSNWAILHLWCFAAFRSRESMNGNSEDTAGMVGWWFPSCTSIDAYTHIDVCTHTYIYTYINNHKYIRTHVPTYINACMHPRTYAREQVYRYIYIYLSLSLFTWLYIYMYIYNTYLYLLGPSAKKGFISQDFGFQEFPALDRRTLILWVRDGLQLTVGHFWNWSGWWFQTRHCQRVIQMEDKWWFQTFFIFHHIWYNPSHWLLFFRGVETTNQWLFIANYNWKNGGWLRM